MILSSDCNEKIQDELKFQVLTSLYEDSTQWKLTDKKLDNILLNLNKFPGNKAISHIDPEIEILGKMKADSSIWKANFIRINKGKGHLYYHSDPIFLTNYYLLNAQSASYTEAIFSYLKDQKTLWFVDTQKKNTSASPLSFVLKNPPLRYAWWLFLAGLCTFAFFGAKRKQRIIPVVEPLKNKSVDFVQSIGNLYLQEGDFHEMMEKKAQYFLQRVKMELLIDGQKIDNAFANKLQLKTGASEDKINTALALIKKGTDPYASVTKEELITMNRLLDEILPISK